MIEAHKHGVKILAVLDKANETGKYSAATFLMNAGIQTFIDDQHAIAYNKVMVLDSATVITSSFNFTKAADVPSPRRSGHGRSTGVSCDTRIARHTHHNRLCVKGRWHTPACCLDGIQRSMRRSEESDIVPGVTIGSKHSAMVVGWLHGEAGSTQ